jgi:hypothetical protein
MEDQIQKLETLFDLTSHPGWKILTEDMEDRIDAIKESLTQGEVSAYDLGLAQAHVKVFREITTLRNMVEIAIKQSIEDATDSI